MLLKIKAKPGSKETKFDTIQGIVYLKSRAEDNKANIELIKTLAKHYKVSSSQIRIIKGLTSKEKIIEIN